MRKANELSITEMKSALRGRRYHFYCGWNGDSKDITIKTVRRSKEHKGFFDLVGNNLKGEKEAMLLSKITMTSLLRYGHYEEHNEIDHCPYKNTHKIFN